MKPLLLCCRPEGAQTIELFEELFATPGLELWEAAVSRSARAVGALRRLSFKCRTFCEHEAEELITGLGRFDLIIVSPLSLNTLAKFALGLRDSFPSEILATAASIGLPILLDNRAVSSLTSTFNPHLQKVYRHHWESVLGGTIRSFAPETFSETIAILIKTRRALEHTGHLGGRTIITRDDVIAAENSLQPLCVPRGAIVTDLAREEAAARGVVLNFE